LDTADDIGDRKSKDKNWPLKTTADEIEEEYTLIGLNGFTFRKFAECNFTTRGRK